MSFSRGGNIIITGSILQNANIEHELQLLVQLLHQYNTGKRMVSSFELLQRNKITQDKEKIQEELLYVSYKPFYFLIGKN